MVREALLVDLRDSPACAKARICLQLKGLAYRRVPPALVEVLRGVRVPRLVFDDTTIVPADRIAQQLEVRCPTPPLVPADADARAYCDLLEGWADAALAAAVRQVMWGPPAVRRRLARAVADEVTSGPLVPLVSAVLDRRAARYACSAGDAQAAVHACVRVLDTMLGERAFLLGKTITRADVAAFAQLACAHRASDDLVLDRGSAVAAWMERLAAEPAVMGAFES